MGDGVLEVVRLAEDALARVPLAAPLSALAARGNADALAALSAAVAARRSADVVAAPRAVAEFDIGSEQGGG